MFDIGGTELLLIAVVALIVIGPKDLPRVLRVVGQYTGKARAMTRHLRSGFDEMMRQAELEEMEKKWADYNRQVMQQTPTVPGSTPPAGTPPAETDYGQTDHGQTESSPPESGPQESGQAESGLPETVPSELPSPAATPPAAEPGPDQP